MTTRTIKTTSLTEAQQGQFILGWKDAGGYMGDYETPMPWCCPWFFQEEIEVDGKTPYEWGASWWSNCRADVISQLASEETV